MKLDTKNTKLNIIINPESLETFHPSYASRKVKKENNAIRNRISDFDKRRISQPNIQLSDQPWITDNGRFYTRGRIIRPDG